jgi:hydroxypyruvate reductase/glycerate 2-kinase
VPNNSSPLRDHARAIWQAAVAAVDPFRLVRDALSDPQSDLRTALENASRILVVGGGKAGAAMAEGVETALADRLDRVQGVLNVPAESVRQLHTIRLHPGRPAGTNQPTREGVAGVLAMLDLIGQATPGDVVLCLLSGGGSALLPAPSEGVTLEDKQQVTALLHACGATIGEMNCVRKHLSRFKGGQLAGAFLERTGGRGDLFSLILSDVIGDPLDVIASGPTAADPTTFADALAVLERFNLGSRVPPIILEHLRKGRVGLVPETPKTLPDNVRNLVLGNNRKALDAARAKAEALCYHVLDLGALIEGETRPVATAFAGIVRSIRIDGRPLSPPVCLLSGGETTVTLGPNHGRGGRNQEFVLATAVHLGVQGMRNVVILSGGTDGEDGPTDAAGAIADQEILERTQEQGLDAAHHLTQHDAYPFFAATGGLLQTGLTGTNVMDVRVILIGE